ncbi:helix-turn-helix domain-containing protein [Streptomyces sp. NPDC093600]|uniref:RICIN domain-containing protein n=1 Tax=Streptomyces sp. NPDC093600 TaxID=3366047 RepID=UPI0037F9F351
MTEGDAGGRSAPDPREATDPAAFVARLQALKDWSGLTYRELSVRAEARGDVLPRSTVANMLARTTVPREELLTTFVLACGVDPAELGSWQEVREELAVRGVREVSAPGPGPGLGATGPAGQDAAVEARTEAEAGTEPGTGAGAGCETDDGTDAGAGTAWPGSPDPGPDQPPPAPRWRIGRTLVALVAVAGLVLAAVSVVLAVVRDGSGTAPPRLTAPAAGDVHIRVIGSDLCLNERRGDRSGQVYQVECADAVVPRYSLKSLGGGRWQILSDHPDYGPGCSGIPSGGRAPDAPLQDSECGDPSRVERFALEPFGTPVEGYRIVPVGSQIDGLCLTVLGDPAAAWSRLAQSPCRADSAAQLFSFDRRTGGDTS